MPFRTASPFPRLAYGVQAAVGLQFVTIVALQHSTVLRPGGHRAIRKNLPR